MNIQIQAFGLIILALLYIFYKSNRSLQLYTDMLFRRTLYISIINISLDILSIIAIEFKEQLPNILVIVVCKLYILSLVWEAATALNYVLADLFDEKRLRRTTGFLYLASLIQGIIIAFLPINIHRTEDEVYTYGPAVITVYIFALCHIISTLVVIFACRKKPNRRRRVAVGMWMSVWICAALVQYFNNSLLIVGFASVVGMMILFILVENPQSNIDRRIGCFNSYALSEFSHRLFEHGTEFSLLEVCHKNSDPQKSEEYTENTLKKVMSMAGTNKDLYVFRSENDAIIISENTKLLRNFGKSLKDAFCEGECGRKHTLVFVEHAEAFGNMTELFRFLAFTESSAEMCSEMYIADNDVINRYRERSLIEQEITNALAEDRVEVFLQPIYSNSEQKFTSAEALVRIRKTDGSLLRPDLFIPFAEGIETEEEIKGMNCEKIDYIQGYYYSRPLPMNDFLEFISAPAIR